MLNFHEMDQLLVNEAMVKDYFGSILAEQETSTPLYTTPISKAKGDTKQSILAAIPKSGPEEKVFKYARSRGQLHPSDPVNQYQAIPDARNINVVWITGMWSGIVPGTGKYSQLLKPLGYNIRVIRTIASMRTAGLGRIIRHLPGGWIDKIHQGWAGKHVAKNQEKVGQEMEGEPDVIIGSSQGGAIALSIASQYPSTPMILLCPAWKIFRVTPKYLNPQSIIIHGINDMEVPFEDSQELAKEFGVKLIPTNDAHIMQQGLSILISQLHNMTAGLAKRKADQDIESQRQLEVNLWLA